MIEHLKQRRESCAPWDFSALLNYLNINKLLFELVLLRQTSVTEHEKIKLFFEVTRD